MSKLTDNPEISKDAIIELVGKNVKIINIDYNVSQDWIEGITIQTKEGKYIEFIVHYEQDWDAGILATKIR